MKKISLHTTLITILVAAFSPTTAQGLPKIEQPTFKKDTFNIAKYGAVADGVTINTITINKAIDDCSRKGGGVVLVPAGFWNTGPVVLKSNVNLHLQKGAVLQFSDDFNQYLLVEGNWEGLPQMRNQSPISAQGQQNIAITDSDIIDGNGDAWRMVKKEKLTESQWKKLVASGGPVVDVLNSDNLSFNKITYRDGSELLFRIGGDCTGKIAITNTDASKAKQKVQYEFGASEKASL